ncbi:MAG TPA: glycerophosphodiester phosphodiesterase family protein [Jatrophihabitantaceae bacterium]|nr:glycerophosphodiester phosphodiesterase family protein [Jatrophihabitantaceae bacterium]
MIAHRGDSVEVAEHTLAAYVAAIEAGADGLECDVRMTRDGHLVCVHDRRVDRTSDGTGTVSDHDLAELERMDFASWRVEWPDSADDLINDNPYLRGVRPERVSPGGGVLTLDELLALAADAERPIRLAIETKHPTRYAGLVEKELVRTLRRFGHPAAVPPTEQLAAVMSFAPIALRRVRLLAPAIPTVLLHRKAPVETPPTGTPIVGPSIEAVRADPTGVARAHAAGNQVWVWTVDEPADVEFVLGLHPEAIITNRPRAVLDARKR